MNLDETLKEIVGRYVDGSKEQNDMLMELLGVYSECLTESKNARQKEFDEQLCRYREQIADINQWASILVSKAGSLRPRVRNAMIADIQNRSTD